MSKITLNVITVVWNDVYGLKKTLHSLLNLHEKNHNIDFKIKIQDGNSDDDTVSYANSFISQYSNNLFNIEFISEEDEGIFDAMNRASSGLKHNDLVLYLNAGDVISKKIDINMFYDSLQIFFRDKAKICAFRSRNIIKDIEYYMPSEKIKNNNDYLEWIRNNTPVHQALIFKFDDKFKLHYPVNFKIQADSILIYYLFKFQGKPIFFDITLCDFELGGLSNSYKSIKKVITQIKEQKIVSDLRNENKFIIFIRMISLILKFFLHNILGSKFYLLHAYLKKILAK